MMEMAFVAFVNLSWQLALAFAILKLVLTVFKAGSSIRCIVWLCVVLSPVVVLPLNMITSDLALLYQANFYKGGPADSIKIIDQIINSTPENIAYKSMPNALWISQEWV